jgi:hypothetical protein
LLHSAAGMSILSTGTNAVAQHQLPQLRQDVAMALEIIPKSRRSSEGEFEELHYRRNGVPGNGFENQSEVLVWVHRVRKLACELRHCATGYVYGSARNVIYTKNRLRRAWAKRLL